MPSVGMVAKHPLNAADADVELTFQVLLAGTGPTLANQGFDIARRQPVVEPPRTGQPRAVVTDKFAGKRGFIGRSPAVPGYARFGRRGGQQGRKARNQGRDLR
jgi:hypothetical protein